MGTHSLGAAVACTDRQTNIALSLSRPAPLVLPRIEGGGEAGRRGRAREGAPAYALVQCQDSSVAAATTAGVKNGRKGRWQRSQFVISPHSRTRHEKEGRKKSSRKEGSAQVGMRSLMRSHPNCTALLHKSHLDLRYLGVSGHQQSFLYIGGCHSYVVLLIPSLCKLVDIHQ